MLGGLALYVTTLYCGPRQRTGQGRGREGAGLYPELGFFGFCEGYSPALASEVARQAALLPSFELARRELLRRGVGLDIKVVHGLSLRLGQEVLTARKRDLLRWRAGLLDAGAELSGKRVAVAVDGGRVRLRERLRAQKGRGKHKTKRRGWRAEWREPKKFVIFELDARGRMKKGTRPFIDGTLEGPDALIELLAMRLHQLGAGQARELVFAADGGPWIWNRLDWAVARLGLAPERVEKVLDYCHAVHHVGLALDALGFGIEARERVYRRHKRHVYRGRPDLLLRELKEYAKGKRRSNPVWGEIEYFEKHAAHMEYARLRRSGKPMGSGAVESAIRRVLNQRLKGNGIMWKAENAEAMMVLRGTVLSDRWDETLERVRAMMATDRRIDWHWSSPHPQSDVNAASDAQTPPVQLLEPKQARTRTA